MRLFEYSHRSSEQLETYWFLYMSGPPTPLAEWTCVELGEFGSASGIARAPEARTEPPVLIGKDSRSDRYLLGRSARLNRPLGTSAVAMSPPRRGIYVVWISRGFLQVDRI
jgi:hypothetical protein